MEINFTETKWCTDSSGDWLMIKLPLDSIKQIIDKIKPSKVYTLIIQKYRKKRTKDQNAYFWEICGQLAANIGSTTVEVYRDLIRNIGNNFEVVPVRADRVKTFTEVWGKNGLGWVCDVLGESQIEGYTNVIAYYGSSVYDVEQMRTLIDLLIAECAEQGINTDSPQFEALLNDYKEGNDND